MPQDLILLDADRIRFVDPLGAVRLDTNDKLFHIVGPTINNFASPVSIPAVGGSGSSTPNISQTNDTVIATGRNPACTHVVGAVKFIGSGAWAAPFGRLVSYPGGSIVWGMDSPTGGGATNPDVALAMTFEFFMSGTNVVMRQEVRIDDATVAYGFNAFQICWALDTGVWT